MTREINCEACGATWRVDYPQPLTVTVQSCSRCGRFKFDMRIAGRPIKLSGNSAQRI